MISEPAGCERPDRIDAQHPPHRSKDATHREQEHQEAGAETHPLSRRAPRLLLLAASATAVERRADGDATGNNDNHLNEQRTSERAGPTPTRAQQGECARLLHRQDEEEQTGDDDHDEETQEDDHAQRLADTRNARRLADSLRPGRALRRPEPRVDLVADRRRLAPSSVRTATADGYTAVACGVGVTRAASRTCRTW